jgi:hypothetical protein
MVDYREARLWRESLGPTADTDGVAMARERLRNVFSTFRARAKHLAGEINRELPGFTVHDITHLDALWEMADLVAGPGISLTPPEAFILGGAILTHDLGMGLAAYPEGLGALRKTDVWRDAVALRWRARHGRRPAAKELEAPGADIEREATGEALRTLHASRAAELPASVSWRDGAGNVFNLIEDVELRQAFGSLIGRIAYSHHWPVSKLRTEFSETLGALGDFPREWTVDPLKLACLVRLADATHIDARRAPGFLRALRRLDDVSDPHWAFQARLHKPVLRGERLEYSSASAFTLKEAPAWRLLLDTLRMIDHELRQVDALRSDLGVQRFAARGVVGVDDPERLAKLIRVEGWVPVDARIQVRNVASLVRHLGGEDLYGRDLMVPLRELIQNAADAVRARRVLDDSPEDWGDVVVRVGQDEQGHWLEVEDNGVGMSDAVLTGPLLDFGGSYWKSSLAREEFPGLISKGFQPEGRYGIGFFSVFMWGSRVRVTTRRYTEARKDTRVLELEAGAESQPVLRLVAADEQLRDGGTLVRVWFTPPMTPDAVWRRYSNVEQALMQLCPALDVNLHVDLGAGKKRVIRASEWGELDAREFLFKTASFPRVPDVNVREVVEEHARRLRPLRGAEEELLGRACLSMGIAGPLGVITAGGFRASQIGFVTGVLIGIPLRAARSSESPVVDRAELARWASEQAGLLQQAQYSHHELRVAAQVVRACGGHTGPLPFAETGALGNWKTFNELVEWSRQHDTVRLISGTAEDPFSQGAQVSFDPDVLKVGTGTPLRSAAAEAQSFWPWFDERERAWDTDSRGPRTLAGAAMEAIAAAWSMSVEELRTHAVDSDSPERDALVGTGVDGTRVKGWLIAVFRRPRTRA